MIMVLCIAGAVAACKAIGGLWLLLLDRVVTRGDR